MSEAVLYDELVEGRRVIQAAISSSGIEGDIHVASGTPKGSWAHIYYVSFHDSISSTGPTNGLYPVFWMSVDQSTCWLSVCLAAASVGISGRGGWSKRRGRLLIERARFLGKKLPPGLGWERGPVPLGSAGSFLHTRADVELSGGKGYECGAIISKNFDPQYPPPDLDKWIRQAFEYSRSIFEGELQYIVGVAPKTEAREEYDQLASAITGKAAEDLFRKWAVETHPEWGRAVDRTDRVGLGYDFDFPDSLIHVEVKGARGSMEDIRLTDREWSAAEKHGKRYLLCLVTDIDSATGPQYSLIRDPYSAMGKDAIRCTRTQITYSIKRAVLRANL